MTTQENISMSSKTIDIPLRVTMSALDGVPFEFSSSIQDGKIVITPTEKDMQFDRVDTEDSFEFETPILEQPTEVSTVGETVVKSTSFSLSADMLTEGNSVGVVAYIDEIGQIVIESPDENNAFVSAVINNSLNLVTEEMSVVDYFGYTLTNTGDGWDIKDANGTPVDEGVATLAEAKVAVLTHEIHIIEGTLSEEVEETPDSESEDQDTEEQITAEVVLEESASTETDIHNIISRFMKGEMPLFSDDGDPSLGMIKLDDLSSPPYEYYYDPESGAIVSYYTKEEN